ncbi:unnamed protein product [Closterium sp. Yama58-4]|nr:unnamed protein product [Closterium sp. Yama58-4]
MYFTLYFLITRLPDTLRSVRDHFLALDPTTLTVADFEKHLLAAEKYILVVAQLLSTSLVLRRSGLLPLLVGSAAAPGAAGVAGEVEVAVEGAVVEAAGEVEVVGVVVGVEVVVGAAVVPGAVEVAAAVVGEEGAVVAAVVGTGVEPARGGAPVVARGSSSSSSSVSVRPPRLSSFMTDLLRRDVPIFDLDSAMYALTVSAEGHYYLCMPPDPGVATSALGASECALPGTESAQALHTFTLDSSASRGFFRDSTTVTPLPAPVPVSLADPSGGPVLARSTTVLPYPAVLSGELSGLHIPSFSTNLVSNAVLQDHWVDTFTPGGQRVAICLYLPSLPSSHAPPCISCVEGRQRAAPHSSSFPPTEAPLQTLHLDVWGPARVQGQGRERYFLLVVDDYTRYTTVFPLCSKGDVPAVLIPWIRAVRL